MRRSTPTPPRSDLSTAEARRIALAAQGFANAPRRRARSPYDPALERLHVLQIDSVNVFARSHYLPVFSRHGAYDAEHFDRHLWGSGEYTEYWAHEAAFIRVEDRPLFAWRMRDFRERHAARHEALGSTLERVRAQLADGGPRFVRELEAEARVERERRGPWWDWSDTKQAGRSSSRQRARSVSRHSLTLPTTIG